MGICSSILDASFEAAREAGATRITEIVITVGELTEIQDFALEFAWEALTPGTMAEGGVLTINHTAPRSKCLQCGNEFEHDRFEMLCPECGSMGVELLQGRELTIDSIETDDDDEASSSAESAESADRSGAPAAPTASEE